MICAFCIAQDLTESGRSIQEHSTQLLWVSVWPSKLLSWLLILNCLIWLSNVSKVGQRSKPFELHATKLWAHLELFVSLFGGQFSFLIYHSSHCLFVNFSESHWAWAIVHFDKFAVSSLLLDVLHSLSFSLFSSQRSVNIETLKKR